MLNDNSSTSREIISKYLEVLFNKEILILAQEQEKISQFEVERLTKLFDATLVDEYELLEMKATLARDNKETVVASNNVKNSIIVLKELLGLKESSDFDVESINVDVFQLDELNQLKIASISETALSENPSLNSAVLFFTSSKLKSLNCASAS